ncbi:hypothetical protein PInf_002691 [Phytophthora infestans]|nr:hypothetical protein PInf_002691 [Phytophthora infestans]
MVIWRGATSLLVLRIVSPLHLIVLVYIGVVLLLPPDLSISKVVALLVGLDVIIIEPVLLPLLVDLDEGLLVEVELLVEVALLVDVELVVDVEFVLDLDVVLLMLALAQMDVTLLVVEVLRVMYLGVVALVGVIVALVYQDLVVYVPQEVIVVAKQLQIVGMTLLLRLTIMRWMA